MSKITDHKECPDKAKEIIAAWMGKRPFVNPGGAAGKA